MPKHGTLEGACWLLSTHSQRFGIRHCALEKEVTALCKGSHSKYFRLYEPYSLCPYSTLVRKYPQTVSKHRLGTVEVTGDTAGNKTDKDPRSPGADAIVRREGEDSNE